MSSEKIVDVIIPTYNRAKVLEERLPTYWSQPETRKIFIIDSGINTETEEMINRVKNTSPVEIFYHRFPDHEVQQTCKNFGVSQSSAQYIFIGEDDLELPPNHFSILLGKLIEYDVDMFAGRRIYIRDGQSQKDALDDAPKDGKIFRNIPFEAYFEEFFVGDIVVPYLHSNILAKRDVFTDNKYDSRYKGNAFREELDFYLSCIRNGRKMMVTSSTACFHLKSPRKMGSGSQIARLKYEIYVWVNTIKCFWKNGDVFKNKFNFRVPMFYAFLGLFARYSNGLWRRLRKKHS